MINQSLTIAGAAGSLEAVVQQPDNFNGAQIGIVCHPDPQMEGTMQNKVVTTVARALNMQDITTIRFNYRGVGSSEGSYGGVIGEAQDCMSVVTWAQKQWPGAKLTLAGFSFGSYIAAYAATQVETSRLISIAPPVERMPFTKLGPVTCPWLVIQGEADEVVQPEAVYAWFKQLKADKRLVKVPDTGHFFHGKLIELQNLIINS